MRRRISRAGLIGMLLALLISPAAAREDKRANLRLRKRHHPHHYKFQKNVRVKGDLKQSEDGNYTIQLQSLHGHQYGPEDLDSPEDEIVFLDKEQGRYSRIVGGQDAGPNNDKFFTLILKQKDNGSWGNAGCGASLISSCHVLTAAHCVDPERLHLIDAVYVSAYQPFDGNPGVPYHFSPIQSNVTHPGYEPTTNKHDVAILTMTNCLDVAQFPPIELARTGSSVAEGDDMEVMGFGFLDEDSNGSVRTLQKVTVPYIPTIACRNRYVARTHYSVYDDMICAGEQGKDACTRDSGGPLVWTNNLGNKLQYGIVSWGYGCARENLPGVYASVPTHYDWIKQQVCADISLAGGFDCSTDEGGNDDEVVQQAPLVDNDESPSLVPSAVPSAAPSLMASSQPSSFCTNKQGSMTVQTNSGQRVFSCNRMAPGAVAHKHCWSYDEKLNTFGVFHCRASCHPYCVGY